ncbi:MAG: PTS sugar transporter subunit IIC [Brevinema sp.]
MDILRIVAVGILSYLGSLTSPWLFGLTGSWYILARPLVSGVLLGFIFGDITQGAMLGASVQVVYMALISPGGTLPADLSFVAYPTMAFCLVTKAPLPIAISIVVFTGILSKNLHDFILKTNKKWVKYAEVAAKEGDILTLGKIHLWHAQKMAILFRFFSGAIVTSVAICFFKDINIYEIIPTFIYRVLIVLGGLLPILGITTLCVQIVSKYNHGIFFILGIALVYFGIFSYIGLFIFGVVLVTLCFFIENKRETKSSQPVEEEF